LQRIGLAAFENLSLCRGIAWLPFQKLNNSELAWPTSCGIILNIIAYKDKYCVVHSFQSDHEQKASRAQLKLKEITVKVLDFANQKNNKVLQISEVHISQEC
jgi:hypothetical protein